MKIEGYANLPTDWKVLKLEDVTTKITDGTHKTPKYVESGVRFISIKNIRPYKTINWDSYEKYITQEEHQELIKRCKPERGDILFPRIGTLGFAKKIDFDEEVSIFVGLGLLKPDRNIVLDSYLEHYMNSPLIRELSFARATGAGRLTLALKETKKLPCIVPPLDVQRNISDKLDSVLAKVEAAQARLDKIPAILKRFRQSVLAAATSGELTKDWSEDRDKKNWLEYTLNDIADIRDPHPSHRTPKIVEGGVPYIGIGDISNKGVINFENARKVSEEVLKEHNKRYQLNEGDFVFGKIGTLGRATKLPIGIDYTLSANVILIQPKSESVVPEYLMLFLSSPSTMDEIAKQANSTSQSAFGIKKMRAFSTRLPSLAEQKEIVSQINRFFEHANTVEKQYDAAIARLDKLNQSILARAFKGELFARSVKSEIKDIENSVEAIHA